MKPTKKLDTIFHQNLTSYFILPTFVFTPGGIKVSKLTKPM